VTRSENAGTILVPMLCVGTYVFAALRQSTYTNRRTQRSQRKHPFAFFVTFCSIPTNDNNLARLARCVSPATRPTHAQLLDTTLDTGSNEPVEIVFNCGATMFIIRPLERGAAVHSDSSGRIRWSPSGARFHA